MRRIELAPGQVFEEKMLNRVGAFNADALVAATNIVEDVRKRGDEALREYTAKFDGVEMEEFRVSQEAIDEAIAKVDPKVAAAIQKAASQIRDFHERQKQQGWFTMREDGRRKGGAARFGGYLRSRRQSPVPFLGSDERYPRFCCGCEAHCVRNPAHEGRIA